MTVLDWILIAGVALVLLAVVGYYIVKLTKMSPEERKQLVISWLVGAVTIAEKQITETGAGAQKLEMVILEFKKKAPIMCKIITMITKTEDLKDLVENALEIAKTTWNGNN